VGHAFITAVDLYAETSGIGGGPAALPQGLTPLDGILVPTWGAYDLAATLLFPFVAIRFIAAEKESGSLKLLLQFPGTLATKVFVKALVLLSAWVITWLPAFLVMGLWKSYGGHLYGPETLNLLLGYLLRGLLSAGLAIGAAALTESAASAAIVTLGMTVGTWALDFVAAGRGGLLQQLANYTPTAALRSFEQGLLSLNTATVIVAISIAGFALSAIWLHTGRTLRYRFVATALLLVITVITTVSVASFRTSWDLSENRRNSFSARDEAALRQVHQPLLIRVFLSAEDPRLTDLEQNILKKLRRILPKVDVDYAANSRSGLFENAENRYGEIWYEMGDQKIMERSTIEPVVLEQIYKLSAISPPQEVEANEFPGYPLAVRPKWAGLLMYGLWPCVIALAWWLHRK